MFGDDAGFLKVPFDPDPRRVLGARNISKGRQPSAAAALFSARFAAACWHVWCS